MAPVIILKRGMRLIEKALIITVKAVPVTTTRITIIEKILIVLKHKKGSKDKYYRLY